MLKKTIGNRKKNAQFGKIETTTNRGQRVHDSEKGENVIVNLRSASIRTSYYQSNTPSKKQV